MRVKIGRSSWRNARDVWSSTHAAPSRPNHFPTKGRIKSSPKTALTRSSVGLVCVCAVARRGVEVGPRELARNAEPPWPSPARRALLVACLVSLSPRAAPLASSCAPAILVRGVGHANGFSFLCARTTPCIDASARSPRRPKFETRSKPSAGLGCASLPRVAQPAHARIAPFDASQLPHSAFSTDTSHTSSHFPASQRKPGLDHHEAPPPLRAVPRLHRGYPPPLFGLRLPLRKEGALGLGRPRHHPQRAPRGVVLEGPGRGTSKRVEIIHRRS